MSRKASAARDLPVIPHRTWIDLFGMSETQEKVRELLAAERCPQVFMLEGRDGIGKRKLLAYFCGLLACESKSACGSCEGCHAVQRGYHPDLLWIDDEGSLKVADADRIQEHLVYRASGTLSSGSERIVVIVDIERFTDQAANRLLKTLEEPPQGTRILLSCSRPRQLLPTIASRLVRWRVRPPASELSLAWLRERAPELGEDELCLMLNAQGLSPGLAWTRLSQLQSQRELLQRTEALLLQPSPNLELQDLLKQLGWKAPELAQHCEVILNRQYRAGVQTEALRSESLDLRLIRHRRKILRQIYRAGGSGHNYLNTQMAAEAWASKNGDVG